MADGENAALGKNLGKWKGIGAQVLKSYLDSENGGEKDDDNFGIDAFLNDFEDEFPNTVDEGAVKPVYSEEAGRAFDQRPWGLKFGDRPKIHELNQPQRAQELGWRVIDFYPSRERKAEYYRLAGTPAELRTMTQILRGTREITGKNIVFEEWFTLWEDGFPEFRENRSPTNFPLDGENSWRGKTENKPRYREWTKPQQRLDLGYRVIEYWRDRSNESESVILSGTDLDLIRHILQLEFKQDSDRLWLGYPYAEYVYKHPSSVCVQVHLRLTKTPPWEPNSLLQKYNIATFPRPYVTIPNIRPDITWENIKTACGGEGGYDYGFHYAVGRLGEETSEKIGKGGILKIYAATEAEAIKRLEAFASLSQSRLLTVTSGQEKQDKGQRAIDVNFRKVKVQVYPAWFIIINDRLVRSAMGYGGHGKSTASGNKLRRQQKIELWRKPVKVEELMADLMSRN